MTNFVVQLPKTNSFNLKRFCVSASSNGNPPGSSESRGSGPVILELPLDKIKRPLMRTRANDQNKVKELMDSIQQIGLQVPIDVIEVDGNYYVLSPKDKGKEAKEARELLQRLNTANIRVFLDVTGMRLISALGFQPSGVKFAVEQKKL